MGPNMANVFPFFYCLLLALCTLSLSANVFISIDCGSSATYKDENGITWTGDDKYVGTGESRSVQSSKSINHVMDTLRVFTNGMKNCYNIESVKPGRVLLLATFYYGNYDGKSSPPVFHLMFDGNEWATVNNSGPTPSRQEIIYVTNKDSISVCVGQANEGQFPYISALEVRNLDRDHMYNNFNDRYPYATRRRLAYGANKTIRFPDDPYDRQWIRDRFLNGTIQVMSSESLVNNSSSTSTSVMLTGNKPPAAVLNKAVTSANLSSSLDLVMLLPVSNLSVTINMYFSEVSRLRRNQRRSFYIMKDNQRFSPPISPPYGNYTQISFTNIRLPSDTSFSLVAAENSTLPPLINAMEVFYIGDLPLVNATHDRDVKGLASLQEAFSSLEDWSGDPCLPSFYSWDWIVCNYDHSAPRVTTMILVGYRLSGLLPDLSSMDALHTINLSNNSLQGNIPDFLGTLPNLKILNLENNQFNGTIPTSLSTRKGLILRVSGNPDLCTSNTSCPVSAIGPPASSSFHMKSKNILEMLFATIVPSIIVLKLSW